MSPLGFFKLTSKLTVNMLCEEDMSCLLFHQMQSP